VCDVKSCCDDCLQELLKQCEDDTEYCNVQKALAAMTSVVKYVNDAMHQNSIKGFTVIMTLFDV